jgi:hypothetical protein
MMNISSGMTTIDEGGILDSWLGGIICLYINSTFERCWLGRITERHSAAMSMWSWVLAFLAWRGALERLAGKAVWFQHVSRHADIMIQ